jgi:HTH-type transcriptional regulator / antitoxin HigA
VTYSSAEVYSPGELLREELAARDWTATEFAEIIERPTQAVSEILNNKKEITAETAVAFAEALGVSAQTWLNVQSRFRLHRLTGPRPLEESMVARRARLRDLVPVAEMRKRKMITDTNVIDVLERDIKKLLGISSFAEIPQFAVAARRSNGSEGLSPQQLAWLGYVRYIAGTRRVAEFDVEKLKALASELPRRLARGADDLAEIGSWFAECGAILVVVEGLRGGKLDGAVMFLDDGRPLIALTARGNRFDSLLFTLLHECAHIALGHISPKTPPWIDEDLLGEEHLGPNETEANEQAERWLFPTGFQVDSSSVAAVRRAADSYGVHASIIIGQINRRTEQWNLFRNQIPKVRGRLGDCEVIS